MYGEDAWKYCFLAYSGRSGSTLLCREIDETFPDVLVVPEFRALEHLAVAGSTDGFLSVAGMNRLLRQDLQLAEEPQVLTTILRQLDDVNSERLGFTDAVDLIVGERVRRSGRSVRIVLLQFGSLPAHRAWLRSQLGDRWAGDLVIVRDPRAVTNSLLRTQRAYHPREDMGRSDPGFCARRWKRQQAAVLRLVTGQMGSPPLVVRFEDFLANSDSAVSPLTGLLGPINRHAAQVVRGFSIPAKERPLHPNLLSPPLVERGTAWREELDPRAQIIVEEETREVAQELGYVIPPSTISRRWMTRWARASSARRQGLYAFRRLWHHRKQFGRIADHLKARQMSWRP